MKKDIISRFYDKADVFFAPFVASFKQSIRLTNRYDRLILVRILSALMGMAIVIALINDFFFHYQSIGINSVLLHALPGTIFLLCISASLRHRWPRITAIVSILLLILFFMIISALLCTALVFTPFPAIDHYLLAADQFMHFSTINLMHSWTHHPHFHYMIQLAYDSWLPQIALTPIVLALLKKEPESMRYMIALFFAFLVGAVIYYFFPTAGPASILHSPDFVEGQRNLALRFYNVHHHLPIINLGEGLIAFPSFHVTYAVLVLYTLFKSCRVLFYPMCVINTLLIYATLALGYHYVLDVVAGFVLAALSIKCANHWVQKASTITSD